MSAPVLPLPAGFGVALDPDTKLLDDLTLFGASPARIMRVSPSGRAALDELLAGQVRSPTGAVLARRLTDAGLLHPRPAPAPHRLDVTVIVPVRDRAAMLARCLDAVGTDRPVVVIDDASRNADEIARVCAARGATVIRRDVNGGPAAARNTGLARIDSEFIAFLDSDCVPPADWIDRLSEHLTDPAVAAVAPRIGAVGSPTLAGRYGAVHGSLDLGDREAKVAPLTRVAYVPTAALFVRHSALSDIAAGGRVFDPELRCGEDVDVIWRLIEAGWRIRYDPSVVVAHDEPDTLRHLLTRRFRYGTSAGPLARRHPTSMPPFVIHPWPLATVIALLACKPMLAAGSFSSGTAALSRTLRAAGVRRVGVARASATSAYQTWLGLGRLSTQFAAPALLAAVATPGRPTRRCAALTLLLGPPVTTWLARRPTIDPLLFAAIHIADDIAYGAGVWAGSIRARTPVALRPILSHRSLTSSPERHSHG